MRNVVRRGWLGLCPENEHHTYSYTRFVNQEPTPFFYCERCNNVLLRKSDQALVQRAHLDKRASDKELAGLWQTILESVPNCPCGGKFNFWSYLKCPTSGLPFPYIDPELTNTRIHEPYIVLMDKALIIGDNPEESYRIAVITGQSLADV